jgi:hypothetical protein
MQESKVSCGNPTVVGIAMIAGAAGLTSALLLAAAMLVVSPREAAANPAMAQKTGQPCGKCHTAKPPELNSYGKSYKAKGK